MKNELQIFNHPKFGEVRTVEINGQIHFVGSDVARALEYARPSEAVSSHCRCTAKRRIPHPQSKNKTMEVNVIPEGDLYCLIVKAADQSNNEKIKEVAEEFERWIFDLVLPTIRKTGSYIAPTKRNLSETNTAAKIILPILKAAGMTDPFLAVTLKSIYAPTGVDIPLDGVVVDKHTFDATQIADRLGVLSKAGLPHSKAVAAIISQVGVSDGERVIVPFQSAINGHSGTSFQYTENVIAKVSLWLQKRNYPTSIVCGDKSFAVNYRPMLRS